MNERVYELENVQGVSAIGKSVFLVGVGWFVLILAAALSGGFDAPAGERPLTILLAVTIPPVVFGMVYLNNRTFNDWVLALDMRHLILLHSWRMVGFGFVFLYFHDRLPALFALPAGLGDAMAAMGAVFLGIALYERASSVSYRRVFLWNTFGLVDFAIAVSMGVLTRTGDVLYLNGPVSSDIMGSFPLALIPGFAVPFYVITHLIIYAKLRQQYLD